MSDHPTPSHHGVREEPTPFPHASNETMRLLLERTSCRAFKDLKIPEDVLQLALEAGIHAPTGGNLQPYTIIRIEDEGRRRQLGEMCQQAFIGQAPVLLLFCIDWHRIERWAALEVAPFTAVNSFRHFWISIQDTVICAQNICTAADSLGLGSVYIGTIMEFLEELREMFTLPQGVMPVVLLCLGYPQTHPSRRRKLGVETVVCRERYREDPDTEVVAAFDRKYPGHRVEVTPERIERIREVCRLAHGEAYADACAKRIEENGYIRPAQRYFGLHYRADAMTEGNDRFLDLMAAFGFGWFKPAPSNPIHRAPGR